MTTEDNNISANPLSGSFGTLGNKPNIDSYAHEESNTVLEETKAILRKTPSGERLLDIMKKHNIPVKTVKGRDVQYTTPDEQSIFLFTPPHYKKDIDVLAVALGCGIRDVEQSIMGFTKPDPQLDPVEFASITFSRSLDIIVTMCQIADELKENLGYEKPLDIIEDLGHGDIYRAYKSKANHDEMIDILIGNVQNEGN